jgi:Sporulation related domain.
MESIPFHIAYSLARYECVIIPDFGALVVSPVISGKSQVSGVLSPPGRFLGFNPDICHNDGFLANLLSKDKNISYKEACKSIREFVDTVKNQLKEYRTVEFPWVGCFSLTKEQKVIFRPAKLLSCNANNFCFSKFHITSIEDLIESQKPVITISTPEKEDDYFYVPIHRKFITYTGTVAAAVAALFLIVTPLNNQSNFPLQKATIFCQNQDLALSNVSPNENSIPQTEIETIPETNLSTTVDSIQEQTTAGPDPAEIQIVPSKYYYIVISSLPTRASAESTLERFKTNGFEDAAITSSGDKHRIYVKKFTDKAEAETYLQEFRIENPQHVKAWLLSQRNV